MEGSSKIERKPDSCGILTRRKLLKYSLRVGLAGMASSVWVSGCSKRDVRKKPNVLLISIDTLRGDHLGCYGYNRPTSPTLDEVASKGLLFEDTMATSPWTLPSHGSLLTGLYPRRHGLKSFYHSLPKMISTMADVFRANGFSTAAIVNSHYLSQRYGLDRGFDEFTYEKEILGLTAPSKVGEMALGWLSKRHRNPFFLFLHFFDIHSDYRALPKYLKQFVRPYRGVADGSTAQLLAFRAGQFSLDDDAVNHMIDLYDASIRQMDDGIGKLLTFLESKNLFDESLIIITSDHGEEFLDHGGVLHSETMYEELIHVPLIICGPGIPKSRRIRNVVSHVDLMPTILSFLGMTRPLLLDGVDVSGFWKTNDFVVPERYLFSEGSKGNIIPDEHSPKHDIKRAVRHPRYKMHYDRLSEQTHLYDLEKDRREKNDISSKHPRLVDAMFSQLKDFMAVNKTGRSLGPLSQEEIERLKSLGYL